MTARMSQYVRVVLGDPATNLGGRARHLLEVLAHYADHTGTAWPSVDALATRMGVTPANVRRARAELARSGLVAIDMSRGGAGNTNRYRFPLAAPIDVVPNPRGGARVGDPATRAVARGNPRATARATRAVAREEDSMEEVHEGDVPTWVAQRWPLTIHVEQVPDGATWEQFA